jgi:phosphoribosyl-ATP pyrophosphohydrolase
MPENSDLQSDLGTTLQNLYATIAQRKLTLPPNSYTTYLFEKGLDKILKKIGEESSETIIAAKNSNLPELTGEISDLIYHLLVLMVEKELPLTAIQAELASRDGKPAEAKYSK